MRGLANDDIKEEILSMMEHISLEDAITLVSKRESEVIEAVNARMPTQTVGFRNTLRRSKRGPKVVTTCPMTQRGATQTKVLLDKGPPEQVKLEVQPAGAISPGIHFAEGDLAAQSTNTRQRDLKLQETHPSW